MIHWTELQTKSFYDTPARERAFALVDEGTFTELMGPETRHASPHLPILGEAVAFDDGVVTGVGLVGSRPVFVISQEGAFIGGAVGEVHGAKMVGIFQQALKTYELAAQKHPEDIEAFRPAVLISFETGGVRLHEANAGLLAHAEVMDLIQDCWGKVPVISLIGSAIGCFGGMGFVGAATDVIIMSDRGRMGLTGPEVIEQEIGKAEFDSADRSLVSRTTGGKHKYIMQDANFLVEDRVSAFREKLIEVLALPYRDVPQFRRIGSLELILEQLALAQQLVDLKPSDSMDVWAFYGNPSPDQLPNMSVEHFKAQTIRRPRGNG